MVHLQSSNPESPRLAYTNSKGKQIFVGITNHARKRFMERWRRVHPTVPLEIAKVDQTMAACFSQAKRMEPFGRKFRTRLKRYGKDTLYFKHSHLTFVVQDAALLTVEISEPGKRYLNKIDPSQTPNTGSKPVASPATFTPPQPYASPQPNAPPQVTPPRSVAAGENAVRIPVPSFRLTGIVLLDDGNPKNVNLGTHEALTSHAEPERLTTKPGFVDLLRRRVQDKYPGAELQGVFIALGKKHEKTLYWRI